MCSSNTNAVRTAELQRGGLTPTQPTAHITVGRGLRGPGLVRAGAPWVHPRRSLTCGHFWGPAVKAMVGGLASSMLQYLLMPCVAPLSAC